MPRTDPGDGSRPHAALVAAAALAVAAAAVYRGALTYFFAQDDFAGLARASGVMPRLHAPWRWVSGQLYFDAMHALAGLHAAPYHAASLAAHVLAAVLVFAVLCGFVSAPAAWLGAAFFATHATSYTALYSISGIGEVLALGFALAALLLARAAGPRRWLALPAFALSLLCKE